MQSCIRGVLRLSVFAFICIGAAVLPTLASAQYYDGTYYDAGYYQTYPYGCGQYSWSYPCDPTGSLTVYVQVTNAQYGNYRAPSDFTIYVAGANPSQRYFAGSQTGTTVRLNGSYSVSVYNQTGYTPSYSGACSGTLQNGDNRVCYVTLAPNYNANYPYPTYPPYHYQPYQPVSPVVVYSEKYVPTLPNTGFEPMSTTTLAFAIAFVAVALGVLYPYVRKAFAIVIR